MFDFNSLTHCPKVIILVPNFIFVRVFNSILIFDVSRILAEISLGNNINMKPFRSKKVCFIIVISHFSL